MKGRWESNINVWFRFMYSQKWNCAASIFTKQNYNVLSHNFHIHVSVSHLYIPRTGLPIWFNRSQIHECRNWEWDLAVHFWEYINQIFGTVCKLQYLLTNFLLMILRLIVCSKVNALIKMYLPFIKKNCFTMCSNSFLNTRIQLSSIIKKHIFQFYFAIRCLLF